MTKISMFRHGRRYIHQHVNCSLSRSRALAPVLATILLILITVVAGAFIMAVMIIALSTPEPINFEITEITNFKTKKTVTFDLDTKVDEFTITVTNLGTRTIKILPGFIKINTTAGEQIQGWTTTETFFIFPNQNGKIKLTTLVATSQLIIGTDYIAVVAALPTDIADDQVDVDPTVISLIFTPSSTDGPVQFELSSKAVLVNVGGNTTVNLNITNFGSIDQTVSLHFYYNKSAVKLVSTTITVVTTSVTRASGDTAGTTELDIILTGITGVSGSTNFWIYLMTGTVIRQIGLLQASY